MSVTVDVAQRVSGVKSMSGFLASVDATQPPDELIVPLRPALWRIAYEWRENRDRLARLKIPIIISLSHTWGRRLGDRTPIDDYSVWEAHVRQIAREGKDYGFIWDIWNEPDSPTFWRGSEAQFFEAFGRAAKAIRAEIGPQAVISGPSLSQYDLPYINRFLDYCKTKELTLNVLCWHELSTDTNISAVTDHLREARRRFLDNPDYQRLGISKIQINEVVGPSAQYRPAEILAYLQALEKGGADGACKACWGDGRGRLWANCANPTLDGIVTPDTAQPRAAWWAYRCYADSVSQRVQSTASDARVVSFASRTAGEDSLAQLVVGYFAARDPSPSAIEIQVRFQNLTALRSLARAQRARLRIERIPDSGERPLERMQVVTEETIPLVQGIAQTVLRNVRLHEAYSITIKPVFAGDAHGPVSPEPNPSVGRPASGLPKLVSLDELNTPAQDWLPWVSPDGLSIYWQVNEPREPPRIWTARRPDRDSSFQGPKALMPGRHPTVTADGLQIVLVEPAGNSLCIATRSAVDRSFTQPHEIAALRPRTPTEECEAPALSADGLTLYFQRSDKGRVEFRYSRRSSGTSPWREADPLPVDWNQVPDRRVTWPCLTSDQRTMYCVHESPIGGGRFMVWTRASLDVRFADFRYLEVPNLANLSGRPARYVEATDELFFSSTRGGDRSDWNLWVIRNFSGNQR